MSRDLADIWRPARCDQPAPHVNMGMSHQLLTWLTQLSKPPPIYTTVTRRPRRNLDIAKLRDALQQTTLCQPDVVCGMNVDDLTQLYYCHVSTTLNHLVPQQTVRCRLRPPDPWFDDDCRVFKRLA